MLREINANEELGAAISNLPVSSLPSATILLTVRSSASRRSGVLGGMPGRLMTRRDDSTCDICRVDFKSLIQEQALSMDFSVTNLRLAFEDFEGKVYCTNGIIRRLVVLPELLNRRSWCCDGSRCE